MMCIEQFTSQRSPDGAVLRRNPGMDMARNLTDTAILPVREDFGYLDVSRPETLIMLRSIRAIRKPAA